MIIENDYTRHLMDNLSHGVYFIDKQGMIIYWNKAAEQLTGYKASEVLGRHYVDNIPVHMNEKGGGKCHDEGSPISRALTSTGVYETEMYIYHKNGDKLPVLIRTAPVLDSSGHIISAMEILEDNSWKVKTLKKMEELEKMSLLDPLTEVGNRRYAEKNLKIRFDEMQRYKHSFGVIFIDIDHFKLLNDTYGHDFGDEVLKVVANTLKRSIRSSDLLVRWGGEEFVAIIVNIGEKGLNQLGNKMGLFVEKASIPNGNDNVKVYISIGVALANPDDTIDTLIKRADHLMYENKTAKRECS
ncbi:MAG: diguanylate cyclase [bacterium]